VGFMPCVACTNPAPTVGASAAPSPYPRYALNPTHVAIESANCMSSAERIKLKNAFIGIQRGTFITKQCPSSYEEYLLYKKALNVQVT
jgi:hypothetical protein